MVAIGWYETGRKTRMNFFILNLAIAGKTDWLLIMTKCCLWVVLKRLCSKPCVLVAIGLSETGRKTRMNFFILNLAIAGKNINFSTDC